MKNINNNYSFLIGLLILIFAASSCNEHSDLGIEVLPMDDLITVKNIVIQDAISSFTFRDDTVKTDESSNSLLGIFNDPVFGKSTINYAAHFRLQAFPDFGENPVADSIKLIIRYRSVYGDTITPQLYRVYELESSIDIDEDYYQSVDLKSLASTQLLGEEIYTPRIVKDSATDQVLQQVFSVPLDIALGNKIVNADSSQLINNDVFLEFFKGLYVEMEMLNNEGGGILALDETSSSSYLGSGLVIYYNNDENRAEESPDTLFMPILVSNYSARINSMTHDYSGTTFEKNLDSELEEDTLIYVQATGGLKSRILIDNLESWKDSLDMAINKAELIFQIDTIASDIHNFAPPTQLLFTVVDSVGTEFLPIDYVFSPDFYGGGLREDYTYRFNITQHLQRIIDGLSDNYGFFLTPANKNNEANRVVLKGAKSTTGIKLIITYSKFSI